MRTIKRLVIVALVIWAAMRTEVNYGVCLNESGDGKLYNGEPYYNYISYRGTGAHTGDKVITLDILNPLNNYCDDIIYRTDFVL